MTYEDKLNKFYEEDLKKLEEELWKQLQLLNKFHSVGVNFNEVEKEAFIAKAKSQLVSLLEEQSNAYKTIRASEFI